MMTKPAVQIRWMIRRDMPEVMAIENGSFPNPWTEEDFLVALRQRNCIGMIAEHKEKVVGFMVYELLKNDLHLLNFAVDPQLRHQGIGSQMVEKMIFKLSQQRRTGIVLEIVETNLDGQLFFKSKGFRAVAVVEDRFEDEDGNVEAYQMRYQLPNPEAAKPYQPKNRISQFFNEQE